MNDTKPQQPDPAARRVALIEDKLDPVELAKVQLATEPGQMAGVRFNSVMECMQVAKLMAVSGVAVPPYLRGNPGACLAVVMRSTVLGIEPFALANWSYETEQKGIKRIGYESAFYHALIEMRAPIKGGLKHEIIGENDGRYCRVWAIRRDTGETIEFKGETLGKLRPPRNEYGTVKGSPLWDRKPEVQLFYDASRDFARIHFPHILAGLPTVDEIMDMEGLDGEHVGADKAKDVTLTLGERLRLKNAVAQQAEPREGFSDTSIHAHIDAAVAAATPAAEGPPADPEGGSKDKRKASTIEGTATEVVAPGGAAIPEATTDAAAGGALTLAAAPPGPDPAPPLESQLPIEDAPTTIAFKRGVADRKAGKKKRDVPQEYRAPNRGPEGLAWIEGFESVKGDDA